MADGTVENELCPVYGVLYDGPDPQPDPEEVSRAEWIPWAEFSRFVDEGGAVSPWCAEQMPRLRALGDDPALWPPGSASDLPPAARHP